MIALIILPDIINGPGWYVTRCGEEVQVDSIDKIRGTDLPRRSYFACRGAYACGTAESWHTSGRVLVFTESDNDITRKIRGNTPVGLS